MKTQPILHKHVCENKRYLNVTQWYKMSWKAALVTHKSTYALPMRSVCTDVPCNVTYFQKRTNYIHVFI